MDPLAQVTIQVRHGCNGRSEWRAVDEVRKIRTPWQDGSGNDAARYAVARTNRNRLTSAHTVDGDWVIVHRY
jgi:hypothetical protein